MLINLKNAAPDGVFCRTPRKFTRLRLNFQLIMLPQQPLREPLQRGVQQDLPSL